MIPAPKTASKPGKADAIPKEREAFYCRHCLDELFDHYSVVLGSKEEAIRRIMDGVAVWASFYRVNTHRFARDYLSIGLKIFQAILLYMR